MSSQPQLIILKASEDDNISPMASPPSRSLALSPTLTQVSFNSSPPESRQNPARASIYKKTMTKREPEPEADTHSDGDNETTAFVGSDRGGTSYNTLSAGSSTGADTQSRQSPATVRRKSQKDKVAPDGANETDGHELSWWQRFAEKYGSVELENKGSVARDHLALGKCLIHLDNVLFSTVPTPTVPWQINDLSTNSASQNVCSSPGYAPHSPSPASA